MNLWGGRFTGETDKHFAAFNASFSFDRRLIFADLRACAVHARALGRAGQALVQARYTIDAMMARTIAVYAELLES
jgi:argininosuccinate lyase